MNPLVEQAIETYKAKARAALNVQAEVKSLEEALRDAERRADEAERQARRAERDLLGAIASQN